MSIIECPTCLEINDNRGPLYDGATFKHCPYCLARALGSSPMNIGEKLKGAMYNPNDWKEA